LECRHKADSGRTNTTFQFWKFIRRSAASSGKTPARRPAEDRGYCRTKSIIGQIIGLFPPLGGYQHQWRPSDPAAMAWWGREHAEKTGKKCIRRMFLHIPVDIAFRKGYNHEY
jgi:hypothetical protein